MTGRPAGFYAVRVMLPGGERRRLGGVQLVSGLPVEVVLQTGTRTLMRYSLKPLGDQFRRRSSALMSRDAQARLGFGLSCGITANP